MSNRVVNVWQDTDEAAAAAASMIQFRCRWRCNWRRRIILLLYRMLVIWLSTAYSQANSQPFVHPSPSFDTAPSSLELSYHTSSIHPPLSDPTIQDQHWLRWQTPNSTAFNHPAVRFTFYVDWFNQDHQQHAQLLQPRPSQICRITLISNDVKNMQLPNDDEDEWLECEITHLPRELNLTFLLIMVVSDDDTNTGSPILQGSPFLQIRLPQPNKLPTEFTAPIFMHLMSLTTNDTTPNITTIDRIVNDTEVRQDFALFKNLTSQLNWAVEPDWGHDDLSICDWASDMLTCNSDRTLITKLTFDPISYLPGRAVTDLNFIFDHVHSLTSFASGFAPFLSLDLSGQQNITSIKIRNPGWICDSAQTSSLIPMYLPLVPSSLESLLMSTTCFFIVDVTDKSFPSLKILNVRSAPIPFPLSIIADTMPSLTELYAEEALESDTPDRAGRSGSTLTNYWLENLNTLHPFLIAISMSGGSSSHLEFNATFPIMHSDTLLQLTLSRIHHSYPSTMTNDTLRFLPRLQRVTFTSLFNLVLPLTMFEYVDSTDLYTIDLSNTPVSGSLESLKSISNLSLLFMSQTKLSGTLPQQIATYWPQLYQFYVDSNSLFGPVPSFADLPELVILDLHSNSFSSLPVNFLNNSLTSLNNIDLSYNQIVSALPILNGIAPELLSSTLKIIQLGI